MNITVRPCQSDQDVAAIEHSLPTGASAFHKRRFREVGGVYLLAWQAEKAVGHVLVTPQSKYTEVVDRLGHFPELNALAVAEPYRR